MLVVIVPAMVATSGIDLNASLAMVPLCNVSLACKEMMVKPRAYFRVQPACVPSPPWQQQSGCSTAKKDCSGRKDQAKRGVLAAFVAENMG